MSDTNISVVLHGKGDLRIEERPIPEPGPGQVQIGMSAVGICGSDVHFWTHGAIGEFIVKAPMLLGHESSGIITKVGPGVTHLKPGDRVAIEPGIPCRKCDYCLGGRYNLCPDVTFLATPPDDGSLARYHVHDAGFCFKLPDHVSLEEGALLEPLAVAVHACRRGGVALGHNVFICGAGPIGLMCMLTAKAMGGANICISDISESRLAFAKTMGATKIVHVTSHDVEETAKVVERTLGTRADVTLECSGAEASVLTAVYATKPGGVIMTVGLGQTDKTIPLVITGLREIDIRGVLRYANCYPTALSMVASGAVDVKPLITHRYKLEEALEAFETSRTGAGEAVKVMISCDRT